MVEFPLGAAQTDLVDRSLGWHGPARVLTRLAGGGSGSQVFLLDLDGEPAVLKATEDPAWYDRATHEVAVYRQFGAALREFLPVVRAAHCDPRAVRLLLAAHELYPPAPALTDAAWVGLADRLGRLHRVPLPRPAWLQPRPWPTPGEVADAVRGWAGRGLADLASRAAGQLDTAAGVLAGVGTVLTHGDCHVGNLLRGPNGRPVWIDWQEVCLGSGLGDLVFLWQRAEFAGAHPPRAAMTAAYAQARGPSWDGDLHAALAASELRLLLLDWPPFFAYGSADRQQVMTRRLQQLVDGASSL